MNSLSGRSYHTIGEGGRAILLDERALALVPEDERLIGIRIAGAVRGYRLRQGHAAAVRERKIHGIRSMKDRVDTLSARAGKHDIVHDITSLRSQALRRLHD